MADANHTASAPKTPSQTTVGSKLRDETAIPAMAVPMRTCEKLMSNWRRCRPGQAVASLRAA